MKIVEAEIFRDGGTVYVDAEKGRADAEAFERKFEAREDR